MHPCVFKISFNESVLYVGSAVRPVNSTNATMKFKSTRANLPFYSFVRGLGGWEHVEIEVLQEYPGTTKTELRLREKEWAERLSPMYSEKKGMSPRSNTSGCTGRRSPPVISRREFNFGGIRILLLPRRFELARTRGVVQNELRPRRGGLSGPIIDNFLALFFRPWYKRYS